MASTNHKETTKVMDAVSNTLVKGEPAPVQVPATTKVAEAVVTTEPVNYDPHYGKGGVYFIDTDGVRKPVSQKK